MPSKLHGNFLQSQFDALKRSLVLWDSSMEVKALGIARHDQFGKLIHGLINRTLCRRGIYTLLATPSVAADQAGLLVVDSSLRKRRIGCATFICYIDI